jgi:hypothetical protein
MQPLFYAKLNSTLSYTQLICDLKVVFELHIYITLNEIEGKYETE